ncbi:LOW QUALITY PROTEIN: pyrethroid hydrolase Ces2e-like [Gastrophryne carolinensis]
MAVLPLVVSMQCDTETDGRPVAETRYGRLHGVSVSVNETESLAHAFYGIPFAKPPVGQLRFAAPELPEPWSGVREAADYPPMCIQNPGAILAMLKTFKFPLPTPTLSEDCLYLNVFTPASRGSAKLPVMVFIHGGGFRLGGAIMFEGSALSAIENVVVVSIQYRLGLMGFLSTGDRQISGNYGFLDQVAALRWVQENIEDFGGDRELVTIFGESAGGVSVSALVLSPLTRGLFHRAIAESGSALMPSLMEYNRRNLSDIRSAVAELTSCDSASLLVCLREKSENEMKEVAVALDHLQFAGVVDGEFLNKSAEEILAQKEVAPVPFLMGVNNHEFGWILPRKVEPGVIPLIMDEYFNDTEDPLEIRNRFLDLCSDLVFHFPALRTARYHRDAGHPVYFYEFQHRPSIFKGLKPDFVKADHGDEVFFVVGGPFLKAGIPFSGNHLFQCPLLLNNLFSLCKKGQQVGL